MDNKKNLANFYARGRKTNPKTMGEALSRAINYMHMHPGP